MKESITGEEGSRNWGQPSAAPPADLCTRVLTQLHKPHKTRTQPSLPAHTASHSACVCDSAHPLVSLSSSACPYSACLKTQGLAPFRLLRVEECPQSVFPWLVAHVPSRP